MAIEINGKVYRTPLEQIEKNKEDIEEIKEGGVPIKLYYHNYCGTFKCTNNSYNYIGTFAIDCVSSNRGNGNTLTDLKNMLEKRGYLNTSITSEVPSSDIVKSYGLRTNLSLTRTTINPSIQYPSSMFLHKGEIYVTINISDSNIGNGIVFKVETEAFSMRHLVTEI